MLALQIFSYKLIETNINLTCDIFPVEALKEKEKTVPEKKGTYRVYLLIQNHSYKLCNAVP